MKKVKLMLLALGLSALLLMVVLPTQAGPPEDAFGLWKYTPYIVDVEQHGCNTFLTTYEDGVWSGTFEGTSREDGRVVIHCSGRWSFNAIATFDRVTVDGRRGTLVMSVVGSKPNEKADWKGHWVIIDGTGDLDTLRGQGGWWGPGALGPGQQGDIYYDGKIHFEPR